MRVPRRCESDCGRTIDRPKHTDWPSVIKSKAIEREAGAVRVSSQVELEFTQNVTCIQWLQWDSESDKSVWLCAAMMVAIVFFSKEHKMASMDINNTGQHTGVPRYNRIDMSIHALYSTVHHWLGQLCRCLCACVSVWMCHCDAQRSRCGQVTWWWLLRQQTDRHSWSDNGPLSIVRCLFSLALFFWCPFVSYPPQCGSSVRTQKYDAPANHKHTQRLCRWFQWMMCDHYRYFNLLVSPLCLATVHFGVFPTLSALTTVADSLIIFWLLPLNWVSLNSHLYISHFTPYRTLIFLVQILSIWLFCAASLNALLFWQCSALNAHRSLV